MQEIQPPDRGLKETVNALKNSSLGYIQAKVELASIEGQEAASFVKKKVSIGAMTAFFAIFTYAIFLMLAYGLIQQFALSYVEKISTLLLLNPSNVILLGFFLFHLFFLFIYLVRLARKPSEELFKLTKSELKKDKQWLDEMNNNVK